MAHRNKKEKENPKMSQEDISKLAKVFDLLFQMDRKNKLEGKYDIIENKPQ